MSRVDEQPLERSRPLWQFHVWTATAGRDALLARLHHSIADGIALARVLLRSRTRRAVEERHPAAELSRRSDAAGERAGRLLRGVRHGGGDGAPG